MTQPLYTPAEKTPAPMPEKTASFAKELALAHGFTVKFEGATYPDPAAVWMIEDALQKASQSIMKSSPLDASGVRAANIVTGLIQP